MKISKMIEELNKVQNEHGDIEVCVLDPDQLSAGALSPIPVHLALYDDEEGGSVNILLLDEESANMA